MIVLSFVCPRGGIHCLKSQTRPAKTPSTVSSAEDVTPAMICSAEFAATCSDASRKCKPRAPVPVSQNLVRNSSQSPDQRPRQQEFHPNQSFPNSVGFFSTTSPTRFLFSEKKARTYNPPIPQECKNCDGVLFFFSLFCLTGPNSLYHIINPWSFLILEPSSNPHFLPTDNDEPRIIAPHSIELNSEPI